MIDQTDLEIIRILKEDAKMQLKNIGEQVHLTGQAVSNRIQQLEASGIIKGYTVILDEIKLGNTILAYITIFMKTTDHQAFHNFLKSAPAVVEASRISGDGCYILKVLTHSQEDLNRLLDELLRFGNHRVSISISKIK